VKIQSGIGVVLLFSLFVVVAMLPSNNAQASAPTCHSYSGSGYCEYNGVVQQAYVNSSGFIIVYFDTAFDLSAASSAGIPGVTVSNACGFQVSDNAEYAKMLYATALSAQARGATVSIQLWGTTQGYLKCDRIWINQ
jgi:hypothetical protein